MFASRNLVVVCRRSILCGGLAMLMACLSTVAHAQRYKSIPVDPEASRLKMAFESARRNPAGFGAAEADVDTYLKKSFFPTMTLYTDEALMELAPSRERLFSQWIPQAGNAASQQYLIEMTFNVARVLARGNFHPAVRYNAVLMLGDLNQQLGPPAVPLPKATQELLDLVEQTEFNKIAVPESVKLGALIGLERHSRLGIDPSLKERTTKAMLKVVASETPEDVEKDVHDWVRRTAALVLANQSAKGPSKEVQAALTALIADNKVGLDDRCGTAAAFKKITYPAGADIDGAATTDALAQLTLDVITDAAKLARDYQKEALEGADLSGGPGRGGYGGGYGGGGEYGGGRGGFGGGGMEEDMGPRFERRQLFSRLYDIALGSSSVKTGLAEEPKARLDALTQELGPVVQIMEDKGATDVDVSAKVIELETALKALMQSWGKPVGTADAKPAKKAEAFAEN